MGLQCIECESASVRERRERTIHGCKRFRCRSCGKQFNERSGTRLNRVQRPSDVVALVVLWRLRFKLSLRDLPEMFAQRGMVFSYEAVRQWEAKLTPVLAEELRSRRRDKVGRSWYVDETYLKVGGRWCYLYRAIEGRRTGGPAVQRTARHEDGQGVLLFRQGHHRQHARPGHHGRARQLPACDQERAEPEGASPHQSPP